ncbi:hypothetical protein FHX42_001240 [Saccharopolyspora lacisalsi]|uniref:Uncharacterized protein n=1 Tax=Halosaccharopolyspora lacisalsi TaxID=1000566 RepID=A0A839DXG5_9PSEU|nr:hypothetical protein [Halosaccharopolyspora lacisalsi]MBA8823911.1 hypothetical protein [Halosaccharopolyspora lacisalsi]
MTTNFPLLCGSGQLREYRAAEQRERDQALQPAQAGLARTQQGIGELDPSAQPEVALELDEHQVEPGDDELR